MTEQPANQVPASGQWNLQRIRDIALVVMALAVIMACVTLTVMLFILYPSLQSTIANAETASESLVVAADNLVTLTDDVTTMVESLNSVAANVAEIAERMNAASQSITTLADRLTQLQGELSAASAELSDAIADTTARITVALDAIGKLPGLFGGG